MTCVFLSSFKRDLKKIRDGAIQSDIREIILQIESAESVAQITNLKKLRGRVAHYRIRVGDFRIGVVIESDTITFMRCLNRADIYKYFP